MPPPTRSKLATPDLIEVPLNPSCAAMIELIKIRNLRVPPHRTAANHIRLLAMYDGELINSGWALWRETSQSRKIQATKQF